MASVICSGAPQKPPAPGLGNGSARAGQRLGRGRADFGRGDHAAGVHGNRNRIAKEQPQPAWPGDADHAEYGNHHHERRAGAQYHASKDAVHVCKTILA